MELLNVVRARAIWLVYLNDINPRGKNIGMPIIEWMKSQYGFLKFPSSEFDRSEVGAFTFEAGNFQVRDGSYIAINLNVYNDGFIVDTRSSTRDSEAFIEETLLSLVKDFDLVYRPEMLRKKLYVSELHLRTERKLNNINPRIQEFIRKITSMIDTDNAGLMELSSLGFWWDSATPNGQSNFQFEQVLDTPFSERRYYSKAPLHTEDHLSLLNEFEDLLVG